MYIEILKEMVLKYTLRIRKRGLFWKRWDIFADLLSGNMNKKFTVQICSDLDYEEMVADIYYGDHTVAMITQEKGLENMEIEIFSPKEDLISWKFHLNDFVHIIQFARKIG